MASIDSITSSDFLKALTRTQTDLNITIGELRPLTEELYDKTLEVLYDCFLNDDPLTVGLGQKWSQTYKDVWIGAFKDNLSFVLVNKENGDVMGVRLIKGLKRGTREGSMNVDEFEPGPLKELVRILQRGYELSRFFERFDAMEAFQFWGLCVPKKYRQRGIATLMIQSAIKLIENLGFQSFYIRGGASNNYSKKIYENLGFEILAEIEYDTYTVDGEHILKGKTGDNKSMKEYMLYKTLDKHQ
ncbi:hypothetical protein ACF0H5_013066 [Mactra antiquata]